jgi:hypothetical protein
MKRRDAIKTAIKTAIGSVLGFLAAPFVAKAAVVPVSGPVHFTSVGDPMVTVMETWYPANPDPDHIPGIEYWIENGEQPFTELSHVETRRILRAIKRRREEIAQDFRDNVCPAWEAKLFGDKP